MTKNWNRGGAFLLAGIAFGALVLPGADTQSKVQRGRYIVEQMSMCADCHTPMNAKGEPDKTKWLQGTPLFFKPTVVVPNWADTAPPIAGLAGYTDAQIVRALTTGVGAKGTPMRPPMPMFRFTQGDAEAIVAYLRTLKPAAPPGAAR